ncbi:MAG: DUF2793 domain-containing protein [Actinomycetia bacterium]|nr:DUF2793 domain-containing protein [Actinomycetes bacterium]
MSVDRVDNIKDAPEKALSRVIGHASDGKGGAATLENLKEQLAITSADVAGAVPDTREVATEGGIQGGGPLDGDLTLSLTDTGVSAGAYGGASAVPVITVDAKGRVTAAEEVAVEVPDTGVTPGAYGSATEVPVLTIGADGRVTDAETAPVWRGAYRVQSVNANSPPGSPSTGDVHVVGTSPTGAWSGEAGALAEWTGAAWAFTAPVAGMQAVDVSASPPQTYVRGSSTWGLATIGTGGGDSSAVFAPSSGTITTASGDLRISTVGNLVAGELYISVTNNGTGSGTLNATMPFAAKSSKVMFGINLSTTEALYAFLQVNTTSLVIRKVGSGAYPLATGQALLINLGYERNL